MAYQGGVRVTSLLKRRDHATIEAIVAIIGLDPHQAESAVQSLPRSLAIKIKY